MHPGNIFVAPDGPLHRRRFRHHGHPDHRGPALPRREPTGLLQPRLPPRGRAACANRAGFRTSTRVDEFESAIRTVCEPIYEKPISEISFGHFLLRLFQTARRFNMEVQPQLVLLQKTLLNIEGLGRQLYPELDLWKTAKPFLERWMKEQVGPQVLLPASAPQSAQGLRAASCPSGTRLPGAERRQRRTSAGCSGRSRQLEEMQAGDPPREPAHPVGGQRRCPLRRCHAAGVGCPAWLPPYVAGAAAVVVLGVAGVVLPRAWRADGTLTCGGRPAAPLSSSTRAASACGRYCAR